MYTETDQMLMDMADAKARVTGTYFGMRFVGQAEKSRWNTVQDCEELHIILDGPHFDGTCFYMRNRTGLIINAKMVRSGTHSISIEE